MSNFSLTVSFHDANVDATLREVVGLYEKAFPGQITAYYIQGSYADGTPVEVSDIDLVIVFRNSLEQKQHKIVEQLWENSPHRSIMELDIGMVDEENLRTEGVHPALKLGSKLIYGDDIIRDYPIMPIEAWTRQRMYAAHWLMIHIYARPEPTSAFDLSLNFPDPDDEFYGYINRSVQLPDGREVPSTRNLVRTTGWAASALLALQAGQYTVRKRDCHQLYRQYIGDEWSSLLEDIYHYCREEWHYFVPVEQESRQRLRTICERTLSFERHFLTFYRRYQQAQHYADKI